VLTGSPALLWSAVGGDAVRCALCPHRCLLAPGEAGPCRLRFNEGGALLTRAADEVGVAVRSAMERKPLFHFLPGHATFTLGTNGCSFRCSYCQNAPLSQGSRPLPKLNLSSAPEAVVAAARAAGASALAFSFSEPSVAYEWVRDAMAAGRDAGLPSVWVTNGWVTPELLDLVARDGAPDAVNVDVKAASDERHRWLTGGAGIGPVLDALGAFRAMGCWVEVTSVLVPGHNDDPRSRHTMAGWLLERLGPEAPWHLWRFHPDYQMLDRQPTTTAALESAADEARAQGLRHVYLGPAGGVAPQSTRCAGCGEVVVERQGFVVVRMGVRDGACPHCGRAVAGVWGQKPGRAGV
jgi:pyruvate formate lyase activating enzyme